MATSFEKSLLTFHYNVALSLTLYYFNLYPDAIAFQAGRKTAFTSNI